LQANPWYPLANVCELHSHCIVHLVELVVPAWWKWFMLKLQWNDSPCRFEVCIHVIMHGEYWHQVCLLLGHPAYLCVIAFGHTHFVLDCRVCRLRDCLCTSSHYSQGTVRVYMHISQSYSPGVQPVTPPLLCPPLCADLPATQQRVLGGPSVSLVGRSGASVAVTLATTQQPTPAMGGVQCICNLGPRHSRPAGVWQPAVFFRVCVPWCEEIQIELCLFFQ
jgi:hypothetical protein